MIKKIGCIEIPVADMERAVSFYENVLGLEKTYEHPVWTSFDVGGVMFAREVRKVQRCVRAVHCVCSDLQLVK